MYILIITWPQNMPLVIMEALNSYTHIKELQLESKPQMTKAFPRHTATRMGPITFRDLQRAPLSQGLDTLSSKSQGKVIPINQC